METEMFACILCGKRYPAEDGRRCRNGRHGWTCSDTCQQQFVAQGGIRLQEITGMLLVVEAEARNADKVGVARLLEDARALVVAAAGHLVEPPLERR